MNTCRRCGSHLRPDAGFCVGCGTRLNEERSQREAQRQDKIAWLLLLASCALLAIGACLTVSGEEPKSTAGQTSKPTRVEYVDFTPGGVVSIVRQAEECHATRNKACVQRAAEILVRVYESKSQVDGLDQSVLLQKWKAAMHSGSLDYEPQRYLP